MTSRKATGYALLALAVFALATLACANSRSPVPQTTAPTRLSEPTTVAPTWTVVSATALPTATPTTIPAATPTLPTQRPAVGQVSGRLCYPSEAIPPMTIYARNRDTGETYSVYVDEGNEYRIEIPKPGTYLVFAWTDPGAFTEGSVGGVYSCQAIDAAASMFPGKSPSGGPGESCTDWSDHTPLPVTVGAGETMTDIDVCDFYAPESVPQP